MTRDIELDQFIARPPAAVWRALTEPELLARWWAEGDIKPVEGHRFTLDMGSWGKQQCEILAVDPGRMLRFLFAEGVLDTTITWRLEAEGTGTRLFLTQAGFPDERSFTGMSRGWPAVLTRIEAAAVA
ncbi:SRPBCC family protein [Actinoplanes sp. RD1]|uniref:SRPBCC family protein n=1 Tax=Actinoplanes sp. RD1 TaxID=3064538 RepID=UPI002741D4F1|nr:SRPBCC domain-containing protein [Actinoplanes sp. RD1]